MYGEKFPGAAMDRPVKQAKAPVFKMGDVVENIHSGEVFRIGTITNLNGDLQYAAVLKFYLKDVHPFDLFVSGHNLKKFTGKK